MSSPSQFRNKKEATNYIKWYQVRYRTNIGLPRAPSYRTSMKYRNALNYMRRIAAAKRIQTAFRTVKAKKTATQVLSHLPNFRRLNQNDQKKIMKLAFKI